MNLQKQKKPEGPGTYKKHNEHQNSAICGQTVWLISVKLEQCKYQSDAQRQAILRLYQVILDAQLAAMLTFLEPADEVVTFAFLDSVDDLAVAPIFDDDTAQYQGVLLAARNVVGLINTGRITFPVSSDWA